MICTTTPGIEGHRVLAYHGIVTGEAIMGANIVRDVFASFTDVFGGRSSAYESKLADARHSAFKELEARAARSARTRSSASISIMRSSENPC